MNTATEPVLDILASARDWKSASGIYVNLLVEMEDPPSRSSVYRAVNTLSSMEFQGEGDFEADCMIAEREFEGHGTHYHITDLGLAYLAGEIDGGEFAEDG